MLRDQGPLSQVGQSLSIFPLTVSPEAPCRGTVGGCPLTDAEESKYQHLRRLKPRAHGNRHLGPALFPQDLPSGGSFLLFGVYESLQMCLKSTTKSDLSRKVLDPKEWISQMQDCSVPQTDTHLLLLRKILPKESLLSIWVSLSIRSKAQKLS